MCIWIKSDKEYHYSDRLETHNKDTLPKYSLHNCKRDSFKSNQRSETFRSLPLAGTGEAAMGAAAVAASASANLEVLRAGLEREARARVALGSETAEQLKQMLGPNTFLGR